MSDDPSQIGDLYVLFCVEDKPEEAMIYGQWIIVHSSFFNNRNRGIPTFGLPSPDRRMDILERAFPFDMQKPSDPRVKVTAYLFGRGRKGKGIQTTFHSVM